LADHPSGIGTGSRAVYTLTVGTSSDQTQITPPPIQAWRSPAIPAEATPQPAVPETPTLEWQDFGLTDELPPSVEELRPEADAETPSPGQREGGVSSRPAVGIQAVTQASYPFYDSFESGSLGPDWSTYTTNQGRVAIATSYPYSGSYSLLLDDSVVDSTYSFAAAILTVDLSDQSDVELDFWWREFDDEYDTADGVYISDDNGAAWHRIFSFSDDPTSWRHQIIDLDAAATAGGMTYNDHFQIKFQFYDQQSIPSDGYAIDEVRVRPAPSPTPASFPFYDGFESGDLGDAWMTTFTNEGRVQVDSSYPYAGAYSLLLDDWETDSTYSFAAAILTVDLNGLSDVELDFWWREFDDEYVTADGVYISDDDGANWHKIFSFSDDPTSWRHQVIDLDAAATAGGMAYNDHFQIKFQFYDQQSIPNDGYAIDEVRVRLAPSPTPASFPFYDGFESGGLGDTWMTTFTNEGRVQVDSSYPYAGAYSLLLDDWEGDSIYSFAAAILSVDLSGQDDVKLDFWWREFSDEYDTADGLYISDDEGDHWVKILDFDIDSDDWQHPVLDLDDAAADAGMAFNNHFQIKFQFYDQNSIPTDGYAIDEVRLLAPPPDTPTPTSTPTETPTPTPTHTTTPTLTPTGTWIPTATPEPPPGGGPLRISLVWTDYPGQPAAAKALVNDLDLEVIGPQGRHFYGNEGVYSGGQCLRDGKWDACNNGETVIVPEAPYGSYKVIVHGYEVAQGPQPFALVASGDYLREGVGELRLVYLPLVLRHRP
jgi:hypothetical protein